MSSQVLVDTSTFIAYFRDGADSLIPSLALRDAIILSKIVRLELIKGTKRSERNKLVQFLDGLVQIEEIAPADDAEKILLELHSRGLVLGIADLLILADARRTKSPLLTGDLALAKAARLIKIGVL